MVWPHDQGGWTLKILCCYGRALDLLPYSIYIFVSLTRLFLNLYTAHSDVGGTGSFYKGYRNCNKKGFVCEPPMQPLFVCLSLYCVSLKYKPGKKWALKLLKSSSMPPLKLNSWPHSFVEVSGHNLGSSQTWGFCMDFLNHREGGGGMVSY